MRAIKVPNIPEGKVFCVIIDGRASHKFIELLKSNEINTVGTLPHPDVYEAIAYHPDIMLHHIEDNIIVYAPNTPLKLLEEITKLGFQLIKGHTFLGEKYPATIPYNIARVGNFAFHNTKYTDPLVKEMLEQRGIEFIHVKQGYSKCLTCVVDQNSIITSDTELYKKAKSVGISALLIQPDKSIILEPFDMGFIGGTSGLIGKNRIVFSGDLNLHRNCKEILQFLSLKAIDVVMLNKESLKDLGSILPLIENENF